MKKSFLLVSVLVFFGCNQQPENVSEELPSTPAPQEQPGNNQSPAQQEPTVIQIENSDQEEAKTDEDNRNEDREFQEEPQAFDAEPSLEPEETESGSGSNKEINITQSQTQGMEKTNDIEAKVESGELTEAEARKEVQRLRKEALKAKMKTGE